MGAFPDITREFFELLFDNITSAIFIVDDQARIHLFNDSFKAIFLDDESHVEGGYCGNVIGCRYAVEENLDCGRTSNCSRCDFRNSILSALIEKVPTYKARLSRQFFIRGSKVEKHFQYTTRHINYHGDNMVMVIVDDITELEQKRTQLEELIAAKDRFFSIIAHDLKGPLNTVMGFSSLLANHAQYLSSDEIIEHGTKLNKSVRNMYRLLENLLEWARSQTGSLIPKFQTIAIDTLIEESVELHREWAAKKGIELEVQTNGQVEAVCDLNTIQAVLRNLISNAIKFTPSGGRITLHSSRENGQAVLKVSDTGIGISPDQLQNLFRIDVRQSSNGTNEEKGTGLGLILCREFIELNRGVLHINSSSDAGTTFSVYLPSTPYA